MHTLSNTLDKKPKHQSSKTFFGPSTIQPKLTIGQPNDKYEQEADAMADTVMQMPLGEFTGVVSGGGNPQNPQIQTKCAACEQEEMLQTKSLMMKQAGGEGVATQSLASKLNSSKGGGSPLPFDTNNYMSEAFGNNFSHVKIHTDSNAIQMNQGLNAKAFTHGSDIYFNKGEYAPNSSDGKRLLAHELTHVVQQRGEIRRQVNPSSENVWGFRVSTSMCGCEPEINEAIDSANHFKNEYITCNIPLNNTVTAIENCVNTRNPGSTTAGTTSADGTITVTPTSNSPCDRLIARAVRIHEVFHARQADSYAQTVGGSFYTDWQSLAGNPKRLEILKNRYPAQEAQFTNLWNDAQNWVDGEVESYTWERRFLIAAKRALRRICP